MSYPGKKKTSYIARIKQQNYGPYSPQDKQEIEQSIKGIRWVVILS